MTNTAAQTAEVLRFWFEESTPKQHFAKDPGFDATIRDKFLALYEDLAANGSDRFRGSAEGILAAIIVLDQFSRNMFRDDPRAFAEDAQARALTKHAIDTGFDMEVPEERRSFVYMPLMHSENLADHDLSLKVFEALGSEDGLKYAIAHRDIIARFGHYPHRNAVLGRESTPEEEAHFREHGGF